MTSALCAELAGELEGRSCRPSVGRARSLFVIERICEPTLRKSSRSVCLPFPRSRLLSLLMLTRIAEKSPEIAALCREYQVRRLSVFGSAARNTMRPDSDIDLLVEFEPGRAPSLAGLVRLKAASRASWKPTRSILRRPASLRNPYRRRMILRDLNELYAA
jgi:hypothetical protein